MLLWKVNSSTMCDTGPMKEVLLCIQASRYSTIPKALSKATWLLLELVASPMWWRHYNYNRPRWMFLFSFVVPCCIHLIYFQQFGSEAIISLNVATVPFSPYSFLGRTEQMYVRPFDTVSHLLVLSFDHSILQISLVGLLFY